MKVLLISQGGCGTNWLKARYGSEAVCSGLPDLNPRQRLPYCPPNTKILYLSSHPIEQLKSFSRRDFFAGNHAVRNLGGNEIAFRRIHPEGTIDKYADLGINCFLFARHRKGWDSYARQTGKEIIFVLRESLEDESLLKRLDSWVSSPALNNYPFRQRNDIDISQDTIEKLSRIHREDIFDFEFLRETYAFR